MAPIVRQGWYLREWRKHRGYTQERLAEMIGTSKGYLSDLERGVRRWNQDLLEQLAEALRCSPSHLITVDPTQGEETLWSIYDTLTPVQRRQAMAVIKAIKSESSGTGTDG
jgi:transcriptional regulator with XRE-family HTH domain